jgi:hypothetical protein
VSGFAVISGVTRTLADVIRNATGVAVDVEKSPADDIADSTPLVHLYLYRVEQNSFFENNAWTRPAPTVLEAPPLGLNLFYLITPYGNGQIQVQRTLGEVMKVFHDLPVIPPSAFDPLLADTTEELRVVHRPMPLETMTEFWGAFEAKSYRLSVMYEASVALIDSSLSRVVSPVEERRVLVRPHR